MADLLQSERDVDHWQVIAQAYINSNISTTTTRLLEILGSVDEPLSRAFRQIDTLVMRDNDREREHFLDWIAVLDYEARYEELKTSRMKATGLWLLEDDNYREWRNSNSSSILWLSGISQYSHHGACSADISYSGLG